MLELDTSDAGLRAAVFGASGGIGGALVEALAARAGVQQVFAYSRTPKDFSSTKVESRPIDVGDEAELEAAAAALSEPLDLVLIAIGILHDGELQPERRIRELNADNMLAVYRINTVLPGLIAKHFLPRLRRDGPSVLGAVSARVGSISDNRLGGWTSYRASKSALNMLLKTFSIEHARRWKQSAVVGLHPGTVDTGLSAPYQGNVPDGKLFTPVQSANYLLKVVSELRPEDTGGFFAWDGQRIEY